MQTGVFISGCTGVQPYNMLVTNKFEWLNSYAIAYKCEICIIYSKIFLFEGLTQFFQKLAQMFYPIFVIIATFAIESLT